MTSPGERSDQNKTKRLPADPAQAEGEVILNQAWGGIGKFIEQVSPWLNETGLWIFGSLIGFSLIIQTALITIGPVDIAVKIASAALAFSLPLNVTGLLSLRWVKETTEVKLEDEFVQAFQEESYFTNHVLPPGVLEEKRKQRSAVFLRLAWGILAVTFLMTLIGLIATLWHMAWWIATGFCVMIPISLLLFWLAFNTPSHSRSKIR